MTWFTSWTIEQWIAVLAIAGSAATWVASSAVRALTYRREQQQREWARVYDLLKILNNTNSEYGHWEQLAAVNELKTLTHNRKAVVRIATAVREFWSQGNANQRIVDELDKLIHGEH